LKIQESEAEEEFQDGKEKLFHRFRRLHRLICGICGWDPRIFIKEFTLLEKIKLTHAHHFCVKRLFLKFRRRSSMRGKISFVLSILFLVAALTIYVSAQVQQPDPKTKNMEKAQEALQQQFEKYPDAASNLPRPESVDARIRRLEKRISELEKRIISLERPTVKKFPLGDSN
jgi:hypothetical protein